MYLPTLPSIPLLPSPLLITPPGPPLQRPRRRHILRPLPPISFESEVKDKSDQCGLPTSIESDTEGEGGVGEEDDAEGE